MPVDKFGRMSDTKTKDTGVSLTYINNNYIRSDGNTRITGNLNMGSHTIENLGEPTKPKDAATKEYVDSGGGEIKHLIAVHARYCGNLIIDEYQFTFSGGSFFKSCEEYIEKYKDSKGSATGFLIPHSGRIKKIIAESLFYLNVFEMFQEIEDKLLKSGLLDDDEKQKKLRRMLKN